MQYEPYDYQQYAEQFILEHESAGLFMGMGLGKTVVTLTALDKLLYDTFEVKRVLVIAPLKVAQSTWPEECRKWDHLQGLNPVLILGSQQDRRDALQKRAGIYIINRENVPWLVSELQNDWPFDTVVIDELSGFKSGKAQRFRALKKVRERIDRVIGLTGTPSPNGMLDLWSECYLLDEGKALGRTFGGYRERYFLPDRRNGQIVYSWKLRDGAQEAISERLRGLCVSMRAKDYLQLPDYVPIMHHVRLSRKTMKLYEKMERDMILRLPEGDIDAANAAVLVNKLLQFASGAVYDENGGIRYLHDEKLDVLDELIEQANGEPVLVYYAFRHELKRLRERYPIARELSGPETVAKWNRGEIPILLANPQSAGHGLNLQAGGHIVVWFGFSWSLEYYQQANARLYRMGQQHSVFVHHIAAENTYDEKVLLALDGKELRQNALLETVKARIREVLHAEDRRA